jgi:tRNA(Ile)-lysidine synthase
MVKDRTQLIITPLEESESRKYYLELNHEKIREPLPLEWVVVKKTPSFTIPREPDTACLDFDLLDFPLILRHWQTGDYFQPFGMKGMKKLSDYLIDMKVSRPDKEKVWLLATDRRIVWVVGYRIDDRFRITEKTRQILMIKLSK